MKFQWYGDRATLKYRRKLTDNVDAAGAELADRIREKISVQGPPRSMPNTPPHIDSGELIASYGHETDREAYGVFSAAITSRVGSSVPHARYLEGGTANMAPRPHLVSTLLENDRDLARKMIEP